MAVALNRLPIPGTQHSVINAWDVSSDAQAGFSTDVGTHTVAIGIRKNASRVAD